jgi:hypothetical protein
MVDTPRLTTRVHRALPSAAVAVAGSCLWALAMAGSTYLELLRAGWQLPERIAWVVCIVAAGAAMAFAPAFTLAGVLAGSRGRTVRLAAALLSFGGLTVCVTAALYALQYRSYYAAFHDPVFTVTWGVQQAFTTAGALYQFAVSGVRLYMPVGLAAMFVTGLWFALRRH